MTLMPPAPSTSGPALGETAAKRRVEAEPPPSVDVAPCQPTLLIIDDSPDIHRLLIARLKHENLRFVSAMDGYEGVRLAEEQQPAAVLLDLDMPERDGFATLRELKENPLTSRIPVIILSSTDNVQTKVAGLDLGAEDYITKPFNTAELRARIRAVLRIHSLMRMLEQRAQLDPLTGLWNRQHLERRLREEIESSRRHNHPLTLALADLDHFKRVNDTHGHPAGDAVLEGFASLLTHNLRSCDIPCRYGGEEFAVLLRDTPAEAARHVLERIREALAHTRWPKHPELPVTCSFGLCDDSHVQSSDPATWIDAADQALYAAKRAGRNRIIVAGERPTSSR